MSEKKFNYDNEEDVSTVREHIASILDGLDNSRLVFRTEKEEIALHPFTPVKIKIKARKKGRDCKLSLRLAWKEEKQKEGQISISSE